MIYREPFLVKAYFDAVEGFIKERMRPGPGSIPALLGMFERELRFYREVAPNVGVRVPACYQAEETASGYRLVLEDLSTWREGADPMSVAALLADLHRRWEHRAEDQWPWLKRSTGAAEAIGRLYDDVWASLCERPDVTSAVLNAGRRYVGRVAQLERDEVAFSRLTVIHGDASSGNIRSSAGGEVVLVDWEDVRLAGGAIDLTWYLVSSVEPPLWDAVLDAYGPDEAEIEDAFPHALTQAILTFSDYEPGSPPAVAWIERLEEVARRLR